MATLTKPELYKLTLGLDPKEIKLIEKASKNDFPADHIDIMLDLHKKSPYLFKKAYYLFAKDKEKALPTIFSKDDLDEIQDAQNEINELELILSNRQISPLDSSAEAIKSRNKTIQQLREAIDDKIFDEYNAKYHKYTLKELESTLHNLLEDSEIETAIKDIQTDLNERFDFGLNDKIYNVLELMHDNSITREQKVFIVFAYYQSACGYFDSGESERILSPGEIIQLPDSIELDYTDYVNLNITFNKYYSM